MAYRNVEGRQFSGALSAEIHGVDLAEPLDEATFAEIRQALHDHLVISFCDQTITPEQHLAFSLWFGEIETHAYTKGLCDQPEILSLIKEADDRAANFGGIWHSDVSFHEAPPMGQILNAL